MVNNRFLLDTHIFIWGMEENKRLPEELKKLLTSPRNEIYVSVACLWEMVIKKTSYKKEKFTLDMGVIELSMRIAGFELLPIQTHHVLGLMNLPQHHKDPFDRILISQAISENLTLITSDQKIWKYDLNLLKV